MKKIILVLLLSLVAFANPTFARVDIVPNMLVVESRERSGEIIVLNMSNETRDFEMMMIHYEQLVDGTYTTLNEPSNDAFDFQKAVRFSPRTFRLGPDGRQNVRLSLRRPADLPDGEYRFHMQAVSYATDDESAARGDGNVAIGLAVNVGIAIPVVIRQGQTTQGVSLSDFELLAPNQTESKNTELRFVAARTGTASSLGAIHVEWAPNGSDFTEIGFVKNFNIFTEIDTRNAQIRLDQFPVGGKLKVIYRDFTDKNTILDEVVIDL